MINRRNRSEFVSVGPTVPLSKISHTVDAHVSLHGAEMKTFLSVRAAKSEIIFVNTHEVPSNTCSMQRSRPTRVVIHCCVNEGSFRTVEDRYSLQFVIISDASDQKLRA